MSKRYENREPYPNLKKLEPELNLRSESSKLDVFPKNSLTQEIKRLIDQKVSKQLNYPFDKILYKNLTSLDIEPINTRFPKTEYKSKESELAPNLQDFYYPQKQEETIHIMTLNKITEKNTGIRNFSNIMDRCHLLN